MISDLQGQRFWISKEGISNDGMRFLTVGSNFCGFVNERELFEASQLTSSAMQLMLNTRFHPL